MSDEEKPTALPFVPILRQLLESSVWEADLRVRVLWITMLMISSEPARRGTVDMTVRALAGRACLSPEDTAYALGVLAAEDPSSRTKANGGRRVELLDPERDWGWKILNWGLYEKARARMLGAARVARHRDAQPGRPSVPSVTPRDGPLRVTPGNHEVEVEVEVEGEREGEGDGGRTPRPPALALVASLWARESLRGDPERFWRWHNAYGWPPRDWREAARLWSQREREVLDADAGGAAEEWGKGRPPEAEPAS